MKKTREIKVKTLYRDNKFELEKSTKPIDTVEEKDNRTITLSFASDTPVLREFGYEILDVSEEAMDLTRLKSGAPLLLNHSRNDQIGVIEEVWIESGKSFAQVRFSQSVKASEIYQDVLDQIRNTVSFGYRVSEMEKVDDIENAPAFIVRKFHPFEISLETLPADYSVGVMRNGDEEIENSVVITETITEEDLEKTIPIVIVKEERKIMETKTEKKYEDGIKSERKRLSGLRTMADNVRHIYPEVDSLVEEYSNSSRTVDEFNQAIVEKMNSVKMETIENRTESAEIGMSENELNGYSVVRAMEAMVTGDWSKAGLELEASRAQATVIGSTPRGLYIPVDVLTQTRATASAGADSLIATEFYGQSFIDALRDKSVCLGMGATFLNGLSGDVDIPKATNKITYQWINNETTDVSDTDLTFGAVNLSPTTVAGSVSLTRKMLKQTASPAIEALVRNEMNLGIAQAIDRAALVGSGVGAEPAGIETVATVVRNLSALTWADIVGLETAVTSANADLGSMGYVCSAAQRGDLKTILKDSGSGQFLMGPDGTVNGYKVGVTNSVADSMIFGNFSDLLIAGWGGLDIQLDHSATGARGGLVMRVFSDLDVKFRNEESFSILTNIA